MIKITLDKDTKIEFEIDVNFRTAILGENGIGKSTILKSIHNKDSLLDFIDLYVPKNLTTAFFSQIKDNYEYRKSGGEITKQRLLELFEHKSDVYILDEPTNDLDADNISWLKDYIIKNKLKVIFTSHDIDFIDDVAEFIFYIDNKSVEKTRDKCSSYLRDRKNKIENLYKEYENNLKKRDKLLKSSSDLNKKSYLGTKWKPDDNDKHIKEFKRNRAGNGSKAARILSDRAESIDVEEPKFDPIIKIPFNKHRLKDRNLFYIKSKSVYDKDISLNIKIGDKFIISGSNGCGKTTFLNYLNDLLSKNTILKDDDIYTKYNNFNYKYITQDWYEKINNITIKDFFESENISQQNQYNILSHLNIENDNLEKKFEHISPGMRIKILSGILSEKDLDLIIWDEPTNHIDVMTQIVLKESMEQSNMAIILVTHDMNLLKSNMFNKIDL